MSDKKEEKKTPATPKKTAKKAKGIKGLIQEILRTLKMIVAMVVVVVMFLGGYLIGSRQFELGYVKDKLAGATVLMSGVCLSDGRERPPLNENQVKIIKYDKENNKYRGILRRFSESIECDADNVHIDYLPLYDYIVNGKALKDTEVELVPQQKLEKQDLPQIFNLAQKTIKITGTCNDEMDKEIKPAFVEEVVAISDVESTKNSKGEKDYFLYGTISAGEKSGTVVKCLASKTQRKMLTTETEIKVAEAKKTKKGTDDLIPDNESTKKTYKGKGIYVTGICFNYTTKKMKNAVWCEGEKNLPAFYTYQSTPVKVLLEEFDKTGEDLTRIIGSVKDKKGCLRYVDCDKKKQPELLFEENAK